MIGGIKMEQPLLKQVLVFMITKKHFLYYVYTIVFVLQIMHFCSFLYFWSDREMALVFDVQECLRSIHK
jgi:hypothetical protein